MTIEQILFLELQGTLAKAMVLANECAKQNGDDRYPNEDDTFREQLRTALDACYGLGNALAVQAFIPPSSGAGVAAVTNNARSLVDELIGDGTALK